MPTAKPKFIWATIDHFIWILNVYIFILYLLASGILLSISDIPISNLHKIHHIYIYSIPTICVKQQPEAYGVIFLE